jgi:hypothetical protein
LCGGVIARSLAKNINKVKGCISVKRVRYSFCNRDALCLCNLVGSIGIRVFWIGRQEFRSRSGSQAHSANKENGLYLVQILFRWLSFRSVVLPAQARQGPPNRKGEVLRDQCDFLILSSLPGFTSVVSRAIGKPIHCGGFSV